MTEWPACAGRVLPGSRAPHPNGRTQLAIALTLTSRRLRVGDSNCPDAGHATGVRLSAEARSIAQPRGGGPLECRRSGAGSPAASREPPSASRRRGSPAAWAARQRSPRVSRATVPVTAAHRSGTASPRAGADVAKSRGRERTAAWHDRCSRTAWPRDAPIAGRGRQYVSSHANSPLRPPTTVQSAARLPASRRFPPDARRHAVASQDGRSTQPIGAPPPLARPGIASGAAHPPAAVPARACHGPPPARAGG